MPILFFYIFCFQILSNLSITNKIVVENALILESRTVDTLIFLMHASTAPVNYASIILLILQVDYIEMVTEMKPTKSCLCRRTLRVVTK